MLLPYSAVRAMRCAPGPYQERPPWEWEMASVELWLVSTDAGTLPQPQKRDASF